MATSSVMLNQAVAASGEPRSYFFNGRLLSAEDLQREQSVREGGQRRLARILGCGIAEGLQVSAKGAQGVSIAAGLGLTPSGEVIAIEAIDLQLDAAGSGAAAGFAICAAGLAGGVPLAGLYLLVLTPTWTPQGRAETLLGEIGSCNRRIEVPAVRVRLIELQGPQSAIALNLRNMLAAGLLTPGEGLAQRNAHERVGWWPRQRQDSAWGACAPTLSADDLPLAVLQLDAGAQLQFVDAAAARRRLAPAPGSAGDALWPVSWRVELEAFAGQFLGQLDSNDKDLSQESFELLPPLLLPSAAQLKRYRQVFKKDAVAPTVPHVLSREAFARAIDQGMQAGLVPRIGAEARLAQLEGHSDRLLLRLRAGAASREDSAVDGRGGDLFERNERTSASVASAAAKLLRSGMKGSEGGPSAAELSIAASALTQAPNRLRKPR